MENNPYIGPRPFERSDRERFFGRARETRDLLSLIMAERVVLFYAQSGAGKTSLLNTQIIPALEDDGFRVLPIARVGSAAPQGVDAASVKNVFVFSALLALAGPQAESASLAAQTLPGFLASITDEEHPPIVIFDQFEESLTTHRDRWEDARGFFEQLRDALQAVPKLGVVLAMREDYLAGLDPYAALLPKRLRTRFRMELLGYDGALEAVKRPAQNAGCAYGTGVAERLVDDLRRIQISADRNSTATGALGPYIEPVQLQVVCSRLWDNLPEREERVITWPEIEQFGNIDRALTDFYERALQRTVQESGVSERRLRRWFGSELITPMKTRGLALRGEGDTSGLPNAAVDVLDRQHLIRAEARAGAYWYELAHDRLVDPIVNSNAAYEQARTTTLRITAQEWQKTKSADLLYSGSVLTDAIRFTRTHPEDIEDYEHAFLEASVQAQRVKARNRIVRLTVIAALALGMVIMGALAALAFQSKQEADQQRAVAYEAKATAEAGQQEAERQTRLAQLAVARTWGAQGKNEAVDEPLLGLALALTGARQAEAVDASSAEFQTLRSQVAGMLKQGRVRAVRDTESLVSYLSPDKSLLVTLRDYDWSEMRSTSDLSRVTDLGEGVGAVKFLGDKYLWIYRPQSNTQEVRRVADGTPVSLGGFDQARDRLEDVAANDRYYIASVTPDSPAATAVVPEFQVRTLADGSLIMTLSSPLAFSPDAESKYVASNDGRLFETASGQEIPLEGASNIQSIAFGQPTDPFFAVDYGDRVELRRMSDTQVEYAFASPSKEGIALSPQATSGRGYVNFYSPYSSEVRRIDDASLVVPADKLKETEFSQDAAGTFLALYYLDDQVELRRSADASIVPLPKPIKRVVFMKPPDADYFVVNYTDGTAELRRGAAAELVTELGAPIIWSDDLLFSPDQANTYLIAQAPDEMRAEIWKLTGTPRRLVQIPLEVAINLGAQFDWPRQQVWFDYGRGARDVLDLTALSALSGHEDTASLDQLREFACAQLLTPDRFDPALLKLYLGDDSIPALCPGWP
jgi:hypothetical protein